MNLGWYEILDRVSMIQNQLEDYVVTHGTVLLDGDEDLDKLFANAHEALNKIYNYAGNKWHESCEEE